MSSGSSPLQTVGVSSIESRWLKANSPSLLAFAAGLLILCTGCSARTRVAPPTEALVTQRSGPVELRLTREAFDGESIWLEGVVDLVSDVPTDAVALQLSVFGGGAVLRDQRFFLCGKEWVEFLSPHCAAGGPPKERRIPFVIRGDGTGGSDYQLGVLWGDDARSVKPKAMLRVMKTESSLPDCSTGRCTVFYTLIGEIVNTGPKPLQGVTLGVRFIDASKPTDDMASDTEGEESVTLAIPIAKGGSTPFRLVVDQPVPLELVGRVRPEVRLREVADG